MEKSNFYIKLFQHNTKTIITTNGKGREVEHKALESTQIELWRK